MVRHFDRVKETITTTGTGAFSGSGAIPTGFRGFAATVANGDRVGYICDNGNGEWETGIGVVTLTGGANYTLTRTVVASSNANGLVNFSAGQKILFLGLNSQLVDPPLSTVAADPTTAAIWAAPGPISMTGQATITAFPPAPQAGASRILFMADICTFVNNATIVTPFGVDYLSGAGDIVQVHALTTTTFRLEVHRANPAIDYTALANPGATILLAEYPGDTIQCVGPGVYRNLPPVVGSPGAGGVEGFYNASPTILAAGAQNALAVHTLSQTPVTSGELTVSAAADNNMVPMAAWLTSTALGRTTIPAGPWSVSLFGGVDTVANDRITWPSRRVFEAIIEGMTITTTGSGTSRTATAASGAPFTAGDANADSAIAHYLQTPKGLYQITGYTNATVVTIATPTGYVNESGVAWSKWRGLFTTLCPGAVYWLSPSYQPLGWDSMQGSFTVAATSLLGAIDYVSSIGGATTLTLIYSGDPDTYRGGKIYTPIPAPQAAPPASSASYAAQIASGLIPL